MPLKFGFPVIGDIVQILSGVIDDLIVRNLRTNDPGVGPAIEIRETNPEDVFWFDSSNLQRVAMGIASDELSWRINSGLPVQVQTAAGDSFVVVADGVTMDPFTQPGDVSLITFQNVRLIGVAGVQALSEGPVALESQTDDVTIDAGTLGAGNVEMSGDELHWEGVPLIQADSSFNTTNQSSGGGFTARNTLTGFVANNTPMSVFAWGWLKVEWNGVNPVNPVQLRILVNGIDILGGDYPSLDAITASDLMHLSIAIRTSVTPSTGFSVVLEWRDAAGGSNWTAGSSYLSVLAHPRFE